MSWSPRAPAIQCQFATCDGLLAVKSFKQLMRTMGNDMAMLEAEREETWLCFKHNHMVDEAQRQPGIVVRRTTEGWVWIDNLPWVLFG